ncbi:hypothetical protein NO932_11760 [Pelagibacterium sp. 26DY04]|uniref:hypothetical protein n=1 Tax=Pelagibacterium sp. 26DY04 TaxID=2967130 RepID=UPI002816792D|nr:hypothetical protein [Pelagibacterium sp. 26DY04]WMT85604.1 hypothetical protein NO932_11760 [Pelagibacterium sp. 26DY04]
MTQFIQSSQDQITVAEIKLELGLSGNHLDALIETGIAYGSIQYPRSRSETWLVECNDQFEAACDRLGKIKGMGQERFWQGKPFREVTTLPVPEAIRAAKAWVIRWAMKQTDILDALDAQQRADRAAYAVAAE